MTRIRDKFSARKRLLSPFIWLRVYKIWKLNLPSSKKNLSSFVGWFNKCLISLSAELFKFVRLGSGTGTRSWLCSFWMRGIWNGSMILRNFIQILPGLSCLRIVQATKIWWMKWIYSIYTYNLKIYLQLSLHLIQFVLDLLFLPLLNITEHIEWWGL